MPLVPQPALERVRQDLERVAQLLELRLRLAPLRLALVAEAAQRRLYINGALDAQRTNYTGSFSSGASAMQHPVHVGKLPESVCGPQQPSQS